MMLSVIQNNRQLSFIPNSQECILKSRKKYRLSKKVTFADEKGFNLISVKSVDNFNDLDFKTIYKFELSSMNSNFGHFCSKQDKKPYCKVQKWFMKFSDPTTDLFNVEKRLIRQNVALDSVRLTAKSDPENKWQLSGTVKVKNIQYEKSVSIRVTSNNWNTFKDHKAIYCFTSNFSYILRSSENCDVFWFHLLLPQIIDDGNLSVEFSILFKCKDCEYWDNNDGKNFCLTGCYS